VNTESKPEMAKRIASEVSRDICHLIEAPGQEVTGDEIEQIIVNVILRHIGFNEMTGAPEVPPRKPPLMLSDQQLAARLALHADRYINGSTIEHDLRDAVNRLASTPVPELKPDYVSVPSVLTAENGAKAALLGEFHVDVPSMCEMCEGGEFDEEGTCEFCDGGMVMTQVAVSWTTIKEIWRKAIEHFAATPTPAAPHTDSANEESDEDQGAELRTCPHCGGETTAHIRHCDFCGEPS